MANSNIFDISLDQFASFNMTMQITDTGSVPVSIVSWSFSGSVKEHYNRTTLTTFSIDILDVTQSIIRFSLHPHQTGLFTKPTYVYDIIATNVTPNPDEVYRLLEGKVIPRPGVTESDIP